MVDLVQHPVIQALAWSLVHFVWQGAAIALAAYLAFRVTRSNASLRYAIGVGAMTAMLVAPIATFVSLFDSPAPSSLEEVDASSAADDSSLAALSASATELTAPVTTPAIRISPDVLAVAVVAWLAGVTFFSLRLAGGWVLARRMVRRSVRPAAAQIQQLAARVADRLALGRAVSILESSTVAVPVMVGWLKPAIVLPIAALAGLTPTQVEALLAHELAHVRRHDYLVNLLQSVTEVVLFYHPAVWWLSRRVRVERELCCDDLAVGICDPLVYATALTDLAAMTSPRVALAATDGDLVGRVRRILGHSESHTNSRGNIMSGLALGLVATIAIPVALISATQSQKPTHPQTHVATPAARHTPDAIHLEGRASVHVAPGHPTTLTADHIAVEQTAAGQADQRRIEELRRALEQIQRQLAELEIKRTGEVHPKMVDESRKLPKDVTREQVEKNKAERVKVEERVDALAHAQAARHAETALESAHRQNDVETARRQYEASRTLFEKGLTSRSQLLEAEQALAAAQARGNADAMLVVELQAAREKLARSRTLVEKGLLSQRELADLETLVANLEQRQLRSKVNEAQRASEARAAHVNEADARRLHEVLADRATANQEVRARLADRRAVVDAEQAKVQERRVLRERADEILVAGEANDRVRAGDALGITIEGEPDLPSSYAVRADGTIRIPFVGSIKVVGLTAAEVRAAVGKVLSDRKLGSSSQVRVALRRSRLR